MHKNEELRVTPFYPVADESLHSYILRLYLLTGSSDLSSVINSRNATWANRLHISTIIKRYIVSVKRYDFFKVINNSFPNSAFYTPIEALNETYEELRHKGITHSHVSDMPINFCKKCFKEQLTNLGFTYFRYYWSFQNFCSIHQIPLLRLSSTTPAKVNRLIQKALALSTDDSTAATKMPRGLGYIDLKQSKTQTVLAPCVKKVAKKLLWKIQVFPGGYTEVIDYQNISKGAIELVRKATYEQEFLLAWNSNIKYCSAERVKKFTKHLFELCVPVPEGSHFIDNFYKLNSSDCDGCTHSCPASTRIPVKVEGASRWDSPNSDFCIYCSDLHITNLLVDIECSNDRVIKQGIHKRKQEEASRPGTRRYKEMERIRQLL